jgi:class 3 adenylate cyclase/tetratricopeptide (TPR) repeat protein
MASGNGDDHVDLRRHIPPVALSWDDEAPGERWRRLPGTLVFADISGFTKLTERLSRRGRIGAEEIVEILNRIFSTMLDLAAARGGELLKFGGDAQLFLFRGEDHAQQACDAAVEMRASLRQARTIPTAVGRLNLSMSVGVRAGDVDLFLVGAPTRELLVLGPAASEVAQAEKAAAAGEIVVTEPTAAALAPDDTRPGPGGRLLLRPRTARTPAVGKTPRTAAGEDRVATLLPKVLCDFLRRIPEAEHRTACLSFVRFSGTDRLLEVEGPQQLAEHLHATVSAVHREAARDDVTLLTTDLDVDGGKFFLAAGLPKASEDDEGRMLRAVRRIMDCDLPVPLQAGVNRGHVFVAEIGTRHQAVLTAGVLLRSSYSGMGDTTNTAARIAAKAWEIDESTGAGIGRLYAHPEVVARSRTRFATSERGPFAMKGKSEPLVVLDVGEEIGAREVSAARRLPFIGRDSELEQMRALMAAACAGHGGTVTISGPAGIGKSRLAREAADLAAAMGAEVFDIHAEPYGASSAFRVFRDPLRAMLGIERADPVTMGRRLDDALRRRAADLLPRAPLLATLISAEVAETDYSRTLDAQFRPQRLADTVVDLLDRFHTGPLVLIADGMQWADAASAAVLDVITRAAPQRPWAVLVTRRDEEGGFDPAVGDPVRLRPLDRSTIERLIDRATEAAPLRPHEAAAVADRAQGNPLFVEEVTQVLKPGDSLDSLPESLQAALSTQIDRLDFHARRILRYCSVLGRTFRREVAVETLQQFDLRVDAATVADLSDFIERDGPHRFRFRNNLVRDTAYDGLAFRVRARVHAAAAAATEHFSTDLDSDAATLALHHWRAGNNSQTWRFACRAAEVARRSYANADAAAQFELALDAGRRLPDVTDAELARVSADLGEVRELAGLLAESVAAYRRAEALTRVPIRRAELMAKRARVHERGGHQMTALRVVGNARRLIRDGDPDDTRGITVRLDTLTALIRLGQERPALARRWALRAVAGARITDDAESLVQALLAIDHADLLMGRPVSGEPTREALRICQTQGFLPRESIAWGNLGVAAFYAGRWDEAAGCYRRSRDTALRAGNDFGAAETDLNLAEILIGQGHIDDAAEILTKAIKILQVSGLSIEADYGRLQLARVDLARGDYEVAATDAATVATRCRDEHPITALEARLVQAQALTLSGGATAALALVAEWAARAGEDAAPMKARIHLEQARALLDLDRLPEAEDQIAAGLAAADETDLPYEKSLLIRLSARVAAKQGRSAQAAAARSEADRIMQRLGARA